MENKINLKLDDNSIKVNNENNNVNLEGIDIKMENKLEDPNFIDIKAEQEEDKKSVNIKVPKIEIKNDIAINPEISKVVIEQPKLESKINLKKRELTNLRFIPILEDEEDKKIEINTNINNKNNISKSGEDTIYNEENNLKAEFYSNRGNSKKKNKGLPTVGNKTNNFTTSKIDVAGRLNVDNVDVKNLKSANVGINGVKIGDRIIE